MPSIGETQVLDSVVHKEPIRQEHVVESSLGSVVGEFKSDWTRRTLLARRSRWDMVRISCKIMCAWKEFIDERTIKEVNLEEAMMCPRRRGRVWEDSVVSGTCALMFLPTS